MSQPAAGTVLQSCLNVRFEPVKRSLPRIRYPRPTDQSAQQNFVWNHMHSIIRLILKVQLPTKMKIQRECKSEFVILLVWIYSFSKSFKPPMPLNSFGHVSIISIYKDITFKSHNVIQGSKTILIRLERF